MESLESNDSSLTNNQSLCSLNTLNQALGQGVLLTEEHFHLLCRNKACIKKNLIQVTRMCALTVLINTTLRGQLM